MRIEMIVLALFLTVTQVYDVITTNLVLKKGRGHEGNGFIAKIMGALGQWWWIIKVPVVVIIWLIAAQEPSTASVVALGVIGVVYVLVLYNNFRILWRQPGLF